MSDSELWSRAAPGWAPGVHPVYVRLLAQWLTQHGIAHAIDNGQSGLAGSSLAGHANLPFEPVQRAIVAALRQSGSAWLGLDFGATIQAHMHGIVGAAALASGTLGAALEIVARYAALRFSATRIQLTRGSSRTHLALLPVVDVGAARRFIDDALLAIIDQFIQLLAGGRPASLEYALPAECEDAAAHYVEALGHGVQFGRTVHAGLSLANLEIDRPCLGADAQAHALATGALERELAGIATPGALQPRILALLASLQPPWPTAAAIARRLHLSPRTLHRRLEAESSSVRILVEARRRELAGRLLADRSLPVERVSEMLGYSDPSNFGRSCRRWFGCSPRQFRRRQAGDDPCG